MPSEFRVVETEYGEGSTEVPSELGRHFGIGSVRMCVAPAHGRRVKPTQEARNTRKIHRNSSEIPNPTINHMSTYALAAPKKLLMFAKRMRIVGLIRLHQTIGCVIPGTRSDGLLTIGNDFTEKRAQPLQYFHPLPTTNAAIVADRHARIPATPAAIVSLPCGTHRSSPPRPCGGCRSDARRSTDRSTRRVARCSFHATHRRPASCRTGYMR